MVKSVKPVDHQIKDCVRRISEEDLRWASTRLKDRVGGDVPEVLIMFQEKYGELNKALSAAGSSTAVYDIIDLIDKCMQEEVKRRPGYRTWA